MREIRTSGLTRGEALTLPYSTVEPWRICTNVMCFRLDASTEAFASWAEIGAVVTGQRTSEKAFETVDSLKQSR